MNSEMPDIEIRENPYSNHTVFYMKSDKGRLVSSLDFETKEYEVIDYYIYSPYRRKGYGKEMLRFSVDHARSIGARAIIGVNIVSRESLDVATAVLGGEHINIENIGDYTPEGKDDNTENRTKASLRYIIED